MKRSYRLLFILLMSLFLGPNLSLGQGQTDPDSQRVRQIMAQMSVEEKVGQLFMVEFYEPAGQLGTDIRQLVQDYKVGAVILLAANNNFSNLDTPLGSTPYQVGRLTAELQQLAAEGSGRASFYAPLLIAVDHEGDGWPYTRLRNGFTAVPSNMAIGATWSEESAETVGKIVGQELAAVGINMLLGPVIDVLPKSASTGGNDQGVRLMGVNPFWVGKLSRAYIRGVHDGSQNRVTTVAKHFPGHGHSDRLPDEEVSYLNIDLQELWRTDLRPFLMAMECDRGLPLGITDAIMSSHIEYRLASGGRSGPVSVEPGGMDQIFKLIEEASPHCPRSLVLADTLGANAIRKYYVFNKGEPSGTFNHRRVARDALLAGNDVLMLVAYGPPGSSPAARYESMKDTIRYFQSEYRTSPVFRDRANAALEKVIRLKLKLYPSLDYADVQVNLDEIAGQVGTEAAKVLVDQVAERAVTLIAGRPDLEPPKKRENILIVTDSFLPPFNDSPTPPVALDQVETTIVELYGPDKSGLIDPGHLTSWSFDDMAQLLEAAGEGPAAGLHGNCRSVVPPPGRADPDVLAQADWIIFAMPDLVRCGQGDELVTSFLRSSLLHPEHKVVVLALGAPYYLDSTDAAKLAGYYGLYSKTPPAIKAGVKALFGEITPHRAHPVDIGPEYQLDQRLKPDPNQPWRLEVDPPLESPVVLTETQRMIVARTSPLVDYNGHVVPDETGVTARLYLAGGSQPLQTQLTAQTRDGVATFTLPLTTSGDFVLRVIPADFDLPQAREVALSVVRPATPTQVPAILTVTPAPAPATPQPAVVLPATPTQAPELAQAVTDGEPAATPVDFRPEPQPPSRPSSLADFLNSPAGVALIGAVALILAALITGWFGLQKAGRMPPLTARGKLNSYQKQLQQETANLLQLEERASQFGRLSVPLPLANEIALTRARIEELKAKIEQLSAENQGRASSGSAG